MEIEWETPPESAKRAGSRPGKYADFASALREHPEKWAKLPNDENRRANSAEGLAQNIRRAKVKGFEGGRWETATQEGDVWVAYLGLRKDETQPTQTEASGEEPEEDSDDEVTHARVSGATIRAWAKEQGMDVPERGRLPYDIVEQYKATRLD